MAHDDHDPIPLLSDEEADAVLNAVTVNRAARIVRKLTGTAFDVVFASERNDTASASPVPAASGAAGLGAGHAS